MYKIENKTGIYEFWIKLLRSKKITIMSFGFVEEDCIKFGKNYQLYGVIFLNGANIVIFWNTVKRNTNFNAIDCPAWT